jgi:hypothetical protein
MILLETLIFEDESGIRTIGPSNEDMVQVRGGSQVIELSDDNDEEPFVTPILLDKKRRRIALRPSVKIQRRKTLKLNDNYEERKAVL